MDVHPLPPDEQFPVVANPLPVPGVARPFASFRCVGCDLVYAGDIPAIFEDLPLCPLCDCPSCILSVLEPDASH